jgi:pyrrolysine biosynthesis protein PylC
MKNIVIIGGRLQGVEAVYLAAKANLITTVIDKRDKVPAMALCHRFIQCDVALKESALIDILKKADLILPALENEAALEALTELAEEHHLNLAFDLMAYRISSSKIRSDLLMHDNDIPAPSYYPNCQAPYIVKPSAMSGSEGVAYIETSRELEAFMKSRPNSQEWVVQEYLSGPAYSMEVIGKPGMYKTYETTELFMDSLYDCCRVTAPCSISMQLKKDFSEIAVKLAEMLKLSGIMDVEVIEKDGMLKVLEIDARIPSQTPTAVYHATGVNLVSELVALFCGPLSDSELVSNRLGGLKFVSYEHFLVSPGAVEALGEHIMAAAGPLRLIGGFCGADEVLTDYKQGDSLFRGTFINSCETAEDLEDKRRLMLKELERLQKSLKEG